MIIVDGTQEPCMVFFPNVTIFYVKDFAVFTVTAV